ncbi:MAG TPA: SigE family RNA polymerase sigma factor [Mycobacteriales bacterium]|nr:SigE family RNA polymerase sigma factor [Mycobacteriales bacterium]
MDLDEFVHAHLSSLRWSAFLLCGDWTDADDITQDALVRLATSVGRVRDPAATLAYARKCLFRSFLDTRRRTWRREAPVGEVPEVASDAEAAVETRLDLVAALRDVPPRQRAVIICRFFLDLDVAETARALRCSEGTVKSQTARGLDALRRHPQFDIPKKYAEEAL